MPLPRSTHAGRGELAGPAPSPRQVRSTTLQVTEVEPGVLRLSQPTTPGWAGLARTPAQLAALVASAFTEAQIAAHSAWRGAPYETADGTRTQDTTHRRQPRPTRCGHRRDVHDPRAWALAADGRWIAPGSGQLWHADSQTVQRVMARRVRMGLPAEPVNSGE